MSDDHIKNIEEIFKEVVSENKQLKQQLQEKEELLARQRDCANEASKVHRDTVKSNLQLKQQLQVVLDQDKLRGYPTGIEWKKMIEQIKTIKG